MAYSYKPSCVLPVYTGDSYVLRQQPHRVRGRHPFNVHQRVQRRQVPQGALRRHREHDRGRGPEAASL